MFSVFANFRIDTLSRLKALKLSFKSFNDARIKNWIVNIRGKYKHETKNFLIKNSKSKIKIFHLESNKGWMYDSKELSKYLQSEIVFFWVEDHICLKNKKNYLFECVKEMKKFDIDQMLYSFWHKGNYLKGLHGIKKMDTGKLVFYELNEQNLDKIQKNRINLGYKRIGFLINTVSIFKKKLFLKVLNVRKPWKRRFSKFLPFDFEKRVQDKFWFPIINAIPKKEIFASLDDDHGEKGYSLISRKHYPNFFSRINEVKKREANLSQKKQNYISRVSYFIKNQFNFF